MPQVVIAGAGPIGLHLALTLVQEGLSPREILIIDPRAGHYTRPGHVTSYVFEVVYKSLKLRKDEYVIGHIKDIERELYALVQKKKIPVLNERFIGLQAAETHKPGKKHIIISNGPDNTQTINCDYLFDCTGASRQVVKAVNTYCQNLKQEEPFKIQAYTDVSIKRHYLAYVKMSPEDFNLLEYKDWHVPLMFPYPAEYLKNILKLQKFGWQHYNFPNTYGQRFGKNKVCLYTEIPDECPPEKALEWIKIILVTITGNPGINFEVLPTTSRKWQKKPRLQAFTVNPHYLNTLGCTIPGLPTIAVGGDASDEPNYELAHGIRDGVKKNQALVEGMEIIDGKIYWFDLDHYNVSVKKIRESHANSIKTHYQIRNDILKKNLRTVNYYIDSLLEKGTDIISEEELKALSLDTAAQIDVLEGIASLTRCLSPKGQIKLSQEGAFINKSTIVEAQNKLLAAFTKLPSRHAKKSEAQTQLKALIMAWKNAGSTVFKYGKYEAARTAYQYALSISEVVNNQDSDKHLQLVLMSNIIICQRKSGRSHDACTLGFQALAYYKQHSLNVPDLHKKIQYNTILSIFAVLPSKECKDVLNMSAQLEELIHDTPLSEAQRINFLKKYHGIQKSLNLSYSSEVPLCLST